MENQNILPFPYEYQAISDEEKTLILKLFKSPNAPEFVRLGPKGFIVYKPYVKEAGNIYNMPLRPTDVFISTYQRSGTTWTQELVWLLMNDLDYTKAATIPLTVRYTFLEVFMYFSEEWDDEIKKVAAIKQDNDQEEKLLELFKFLVTPGNRLLEAIPSPRFVKTHLPMSLMPPNLLDTVKMVYVARDPRDVAVSSYHHARLFTTARFEGTFKEFWNIFYKSLFTLTPYFEHVKEAWEKRHHPNMLFLLYEELSKDLPAAIRRIADFFGKKLNEEQMSKLCDHLNIANFKQNQSVNYQEFRELGMLAADETFIRKGKAGGWRDYFDEEMIQQAEQWIADNLRDTDLRFPNLN